MLTKLRDSVAGLSVCGGLTKPAMNASVSDIVTGVVGGAVAVVAAPYVVAAAGFGAGGIAAGSVAAKVMGVAWSTGVGTAAVAALQAVGAAGLTVAQGIVVGTAAGAATAGAVHIATKKPKGVLSDSSSSSSSNNVVLRPLKP